MSEKPLIYDLALPGLIDILERWGEPAYRARQLWHGLYTSFWDAPEQFTTLPKALRRKLSELFSFRHLAPEASLESANGQTRKTLFRLPGGEAIEAVLMRYRKRQTLCISTQAGCAMGCVFCATGQMGFHRNLTSGQIVEQVLFYARALHAEGERLTNVVVMGMGEPFLNYEATMEAIDRLNHPDGFNMGARRFTISTIGIVPVIRRFAAEKRQVNLAISLHAAEDDLRTSMLPVNRKYPIPQLLSACREYVDKTGRRITFEWALIDGLNDAPEQAQKLANLLRMQLTRKNLNCHVNVIPLNPTQGYNGKAATRQRAQTFSKILEQNHISCTIRVRRGIEIQAGCGQLAAQA